MTTLEKAILMRRFGWQTAIVNGIVLTTIVLGWTTAAVAQRRPIADDTLGDESSKVVSPDPQEASDRIEGGAQRGNNLFHSFQEFHVDAGRSVYFADPGVDNILTRVTGGVESQILGVLGVLGDANLFLLNPNGIIFGEDAQLDVGGSFVATTADAIGFPSGDVFSATNPTAPTPLLNVNPNALLFNQLNPQPIINRADGPTPVPGQFSRFIGLAAAPGQTLALVGGDVRLENGRLTALGGRVELGGLSEPGAIGLRMNGSIPRLAFPANVARSDVSLVNVSEINVEADDGGSIAITTRNLNLNEGFIEAGIDNGLGTVDSQAGDIEINATGSIALDVDSGIFNNLGSESTGRGGDIRITTGSLSITSGALLSTGTFGRGDAGDIIIAARDTVSFDGADALRFPGASSEVGERGIGRGGDIRITTGALSITNGAQLNSSTFGRGDAGDIIIAARDTVSFDGTDEDEGLPSGAFSDVVESGIGRGGNIRITTGALSITNGALLGAGTFGQGHAGSIIIAARDTVSFDGTSADDGSPSGAFSDVEEGGIGQGGSIRITTGALSITNGARLDTSTEGQGDAGDIIIAARDTVSFDGRSGNGEFPSGALSTVNPTAIGEGGDIILITADSLALTDGAELSASSSGTGGAGNIRVNAPQVQLDQGGITSETRSGDGGNIDLTVQNTLLLRRGSSISTTAGTAQAGGNGGNIDIDADFIIALPNDNSNIRANAFSGSGGNVDITTEGLFGIAARAQDNPFTSDITASSQQGVQGTVEITIPDVDPGRGLTELPAEVVDASDQITQTCPGVGGGEDASVFVVSGRGGLPSSPIDFLSGEESLVGWAALEEGNIAAVAPPPQSPDLTAEAIVEAQGWSVGQDGAVRLIAAAPAPMVQPSPCN